MMDLRLTLIAGLVVGLSVFMNMPASSAEKTPKTDTPSAQEAAYEPMAVFEKLAGQTMRGTWQGDDGNMVVDISTAEMILDGRAYQGTHKLENSSYGGRTIIFFDESKKEYIFHYFTTAGFHTTGVLDVTETGYAATEQVNGHPSIQAVKSTLTMKEDVFEVAVQYQSKDGTWSDAPLRTYKPYDGPPPFASSTGATDDQ